MPLARGCARANTKRFGPTQERKAKIFPHLFRFLSFFFFFSFLLFRFGLFVCGFNPRFSGGFSGVNSLSNLSNNIECI